MKPMPLYAQATPQRFQPYPGYRPPVAAPRKTAPVLNDVFATLQKAGQSPTQALNTFPFLKKLTGFGKPLAVLGAAYVGFKYLRPRLGFFNAAALVTAGLIGVKWLKNMLPPQSKTTQEIVLQPDILDGLPPEYNDYFKKYPGFYV